MPISKQNLRHDRVLTVDVGINGTGIAVWKLHEWSELKPPVSTENIYARTGSWEDRISAICAKFEDSLKRVRFSGNTVVKCYIEMPEFFSGTRGNAAAVKGDLVKLTLLAGCYTELCRQYDVKTVLVPVKDWKGQLSKGIVEERIKSLLVGVDLSKVKSHSWDAIGIGLWAKGFLHADTTKGDRTAVEKLPQVPTRRRRT